MGRILLTGFEPFHKATQNPTQEIIKAIESQSLAGISTMVLPVVFGSASHMVKAKIDEIQPEIVIMLGQAEGRNQITPEKIAINLDDARIADNDGNQPSQQAIVASGPDGLFSTLPIVRIVETLKRAEIPAAISMSAGTFVCNHIFYAVQHHCLEKNLQTGFIHVPLMESQATEFPGLPTMPLATMVKAVNVILTELSPK